jgi:hypothetical protein
MVECQLNKKRIVKRKYDYRRTGKINCNGIDDFTRIGKEGRKDITNHNKKKGIWELATL